jgi:hypothetical protein
MDLVVEMIFRRDRRLWEANAHVVRSRPSPATSSNAAAATVFVIIPIMDETSRVSSTYLLIASRDRGKVVHNCGHDGAAVNIDEETMASHWRLTTCTMALLRSRLM